MESGNGHIQPVKEKEVVELEGQNSDSKDADYSAFAVQKKPAQTAKQFVEWIPHIDIGLFARKGELRTTPKKVAPPFRFYPNYRFKPVIAGFPAHPKDDEELSSQPEAEVNLKHASSNGGPPEKNPEQAENFQQEQPRSDLPVDQNSSEKDAKTVEEPKKLPADQPPVEKSIEEKTDAGKKGEDQPDSRLPSKSMSVAKDAGTGMKADDKPAKEHLVVNRLQKPVIEEYSSDEETRSESMAKIGSAKRRRISGRKDTAFKKPRMPPKSRSGESHGNAPIKKHHKSVQTVARGNHVLDPIRHERIRFLCSFLQRELGEIGNGPGGQSLEALEPFLGLLRNGNSE